MATNSIIAPAPCVVVRGARPRGIAGGFRTTRLTRRGRTLVTVAVGSALAAMVATTAVRIAVAAGAEPVVAGGPAATVTIVVQPGDSLWSIARRLNTPDDPRKVVGEIRALNQLASALIMPGDVLVVPIHR